jgi:polyphosphate glucokinase
MKILAIDVGGTNIKLLAKGKQDIIKFPSGPEMTAERMVDEVLRLTKAWKYDVVSIGYPSPVVGGKPALEPKNLGPGWVGYDFAAHFGRPVKVLNDAAMQALGSYEGGRMLFLGLGTGLGTAMVIDKVVVPLELGELPYCKGRSFEDYVGRSGLEQLGKKRWREMVLDVIARLKAALVADYVVLGGGNAKLIDELPPSVRRGDNRNAFIGGFRMWENYP